MDPFNGLGYFSELKKYCGKFGIQMELMKIIEIQA